MQTRRRRETVSVAARRDSRRSQLAVRQAEPSRRHVLARVGPQARRALLLSRL